MPTVHVLAIITAKPGRRAEILAAFQVNVPNVHAEDGCLEYTATVQVPAGTLADEGPNSSGVYKLVVIVTHNNFGGPTVLAGFSEGPVIQMRQP